MKITIICGSHRPNSQSSRIGHLLKDELLQLNQASSPQNQTEGEIMDLAGNPLPLWDEGVWENHDKWAQLWTPSKEALETSDGFVIVTPEWGGMVPPGLKNLLLLASGEAMAHKPALIVSVSAGINGAYPIAELRSSGYKNSKICYLPEQIILRKVADFAKDRSQLSEDEQRMITRIRFCLKALKVYCEQFSKIREQIFEESKSYPNGM